MHYLRGVKHIDHNGDANLKLKRDFKVISGYVVEDHYVTDFKTLVTQPNLIVQPFFGKSIYIYYAVRTHFNSVSHDLKRDRKLLN